MSGYLLSPFSGGIDMKDYTAAEDIRDVLQVISLVGKRPYLTGKAEHRATGISYRELFAIEKRLEHALELVEKTGLPGKDDWSNKSPVTRGKKMTRPLGAPRLVQNDLPNGWTVEWRNAGEAVVSGWELMDHGAHRGFYDSEVSAIQAALELSAP